MQNDQTCVLRILHLGKGSSTCYIVSVKFHLSSDTKRLDITSTINDPQPSWIHIRGQDRCDHRWSCMQPSGRKLLGGCGMLLWQVGELFFRVEAETFFFFVCSGDGLLKVVFLDYVYIIMILPFEYYP